MAARLRPGNNPPSRRKRHAGIPPLHKGGMGLAEPLPRAASCGQFRDIAGQVYLDSFYVYQKTSAAYVENSVELVETSVGMPFFLCGPK